MTALNSERPLQLAAVAAGPVFYQTPLYRALHADPRVELTVLFASSSGRRPYDAGFGGRRVVWDIDLLEGYHFRFLKAAESNEMTGGFLALRDWDVIGNVLRGPYDAVWVHSYSYLTLWLAMAAAALRGLPILLREEQTLLHGRPWPKRWIRASLLRLLCRRVYGLYIGSSNRAWFRHYGTPEHRLFPTPYCVDNESLQRQARELKGRQAELRAEFGIGAHARPVILLVGKLEPKKQPLLALEAFAQLRSRHRCALLLVGEGPLEPALRHGIEERRIPDVHFAGFLNRSRIARAYAASDLFVLPSGLHETFGLVVAEAMNFALPVVVSDKVGCAPDLVREGENGFVVPHRDSRRLADALECLVTDPKRRCLAGKRSRELIDEWHYGIAVEGIVRACQSVADQREGRR
jgi:glycosyltransferase involved in cell wall biosynthesis